MYPHSSNLYFFYIFVFAAIYKPFMCMAYFRVKRDKIHLNSRIRLVLLKKLFFKCWGCIFQQFIGSEKGNYRQIISKSEASTGGCSEGFITKKHRFLNNQKKFSSVLLAKYTIFQGWPTIQKLVFDTRQIPVFGDMSKSLKMTVCQ